MADAARLEISGLGAQGDGVAHRDGGIVHVPGALPGEMAERAADGTWRIVGPPSPRRRAMALCSHVARCGGCSVQHMDDELYTGWKSGLLATALAQHGLSCPVLPLASVPPGSRRRATFTGAWLDGTLRLGFHGRETHALEPIADCGVLRPAIVAALPHLTRLAAALVPQGTSFRLSVLAADNGLDISLDRKPPRGLARQATAVADLMRRAKAIRLTCAGEPVLLLARPVVTIAGAELTPPPGAFLQAAAEADALLAAPVLEHIGKAKRVFDLFSGLGTLTLPIARRARVTAVDSEADLLAALAEATSHTRGLKPIERLRRDLFRDPLSPRELETADAVVLDPPRAGADAQCRSLARAKVRRVVMVSCNPATLARDLRTLVDGGYRLDHVAPIDQFLFTHHLEAVATLVRA
jgi:23S rRNA (uracil1939-C5)-methyltransferase